MTPPDARERAIAAVTNAYRDAVHAKDVDAFVALYDPAVRIFDAWDRWSYDGTAAWRAMVAAWFASLDDDRVAVDFDDVGIVAGADVAVLHAFIRYRRVGGPTPQAMSNRLTWTLRRVGDAWSIVHEHTSAPVDHATMKATLAR